MAERYNREVLLQDPRFAKYQRDFLAAVLTKQTYTIAEAVKAAKNYFEKE